MSRSPSGKVALPLQLSGIELGYLPVRKDARLGVQIGAWQYAFMKVVPIAASRSRLGVRTYGLPLGPMASERSWSAQYQRMLGRRLAGDGMGIMTSGR